jgi:hypothetical protein
MGILCFKKKLFSAKEKGDIKEVPGRYGFWEKMVGLRESTSRNPERKKGHPYPSVLKKLYKSVFQMWKWFLPFLKEGELYPQMPFSTKI